MNLNLNGLTALVTASTGGIGLEIARSLAIEGARVVVNGRTQSNVEKALTELRRDLSSADLVGLAADNGTAGGCATTLSTWPQVDILVNNLGIYEAIGFFDETDGAWQKMFEINIMSGVRLARQYLKGMLERGHGRIVFISSESGISPAPEMAHYSATKTMQLGIARSLAELTRGTKVTVNSVLPGPTRTDGVEKFIQDVFPGLTQGRLFDVRDIPLHVDHLSLKPLWQWGRDRVQVAGLSIISAYGAHKTAFGADAGSVDD